MAKKPKPKPIPPKPTPPKIHYVTEGEDPRKKGEVRKKKK